MVGTVIKHGIEWYAPLPIWARNSSLGISDPSSDEAGKPSILRFATDSFMEDLLQLVQKRPDLLKEQIARPETWRQPMETSKPDLRKISESPISYLIKRTKTLADQYKPKKNGISLKSKQSNSDPSLQNSSKGDQDNFLKLYQVGHQRYYLVSASLAIPESNYRDQAIDLRRNERASFVVRRLVRSNENSTKWDEYAFVQNGNDAFWKKIGNYTPESNKILLQNEEQFPLFPIQYNDDCECTRSIHSGLIPVGKRESWMGAPAGGMATDLENPGSSSASKNNSIKRQIFRATVIEPWNLLVEQAFSAHENTNKEIPGSDQDGPAKSIETKKSINSARDQIQTVSWYVLLDFANFLKENIPDVWKVIQGESPETSLQGNEATLHDSLKGTNWDSSLEDKLIPSYLKYFGSYLKQQGLRIYSSGDVTLNLRDALKGITQYEERLESVDVPFIRFGNSEEHLNIPDKWPDFLFPLADPEIRDFAPFGSVDDDDLTLLQSVQAKVDALGDLVNNILSDPDESLAGLPESTTRLDPQEGWFVVRCVYERPHCGPLFPALVSTSTRGFQLAPFFDPDAPARPVRIPLPVDISPAGLRKYKKNASFIISDMLCGKIKKIRSMTFGDLVLSVLPWPFHKDLPNLEDTKPCDNKEGNGLGMICSLSIPIVTLVALILMIIMVTLFNIFFNWLPYLFVCLPIPGFKAKKPNAAPGPNTL